VLPAQTNTGVNPAGNAGDTSPNFLVGGDVNGNIPPILLRTFGYSRTILVALRSFSLKPISFGYKTPPIRFSQAGGQSAHKARPPNLELALTPLHPNIAVHCCLSVCLSRYSVCCYSISVHSCTRRPPVNVDVGAAPLSSFSTLGNSRWPMDDLQRKSRRPKHLESVQSA